MKINGLKKLTTDVLIIGGGTAGCYAALTIREQSDAKIIIAVNEKARIAIKTPGKRETSAKSDPNPLDPSAAPKT